MFAKTLSVILTGLMIDSFYARVGLDKRLGVEVLARACLIASCSVNMDNHACYDDVMIASLETRVVCQDDHVGQDKLPINPP